MKTKFYMELLYMMDIYCVQKITFTVTWCISVIAVKCYNYTKFACSNVYTN